MPTRGHVTSQRDKVSIIFKKVFTQEEEAIIGEYLLKSCGETNPRMTKIFNTTGLTFTGPTLKATSRLIQFKFLLSNVTDKKYSLLDNE